MSRTENVTLTNMCMIYSGTKVLVQEKTDDDYSGITFPGGHVEMEPRHIDNELTLIPYYENYEVTLEWYQDLDLCKQVDNIDYPYTLDRLKRMYTYLSTHGDCFYIEYKSKLVGDITLKDDEISIIICKEYQNRHIGRRCVQNIIELATEKGLTQVRAEIYSFNLQSQKMFISLGFVPFKENWYVLELV